MRRRDCQSREAANNQNRKPEPIIKPALAGQEPATISTEGILGCLHGCVWQFRSSFDFDLCLLQFQFDLKISWYYFLLNLDVNVIPHIGIEMQQEIDLPTAVNCFGLGSSEPGQRHEMTGPEGRDQWFIERTIFSLGWFRFVVALKNSDTYIPISYLQITSLVDSIPK